MKKYVYKIIDIAYRVLLKGRKETLRYKIASKYDIGKDVSFWHNTVITGDGHLSIGNGTYIGQGTFISSQLGGIIEIGKNNRISHGVHIRNSSYDISSKSVFCKKSSVKDIFIGDECWIGANSFIMPGVKIGSYSVVGANTVVTKSVPPGSIVVGAPGRVIRCIEE